MGMIVQEAEAPVSLRRKGARQVNIVLWVVAGILAAMMVVAGGTKASQAREKLAATGPGMAYVEDFDDTTIRAIGIAELIGAAGLILPGIFGVAPILVLISATCLAVLMAGAVVTHLRRGEQFALGMPLALLAASLFVAAGRFFIEPL
jgi:hypothetical protein